MKKPYERPRILDPVMEWRPFARIYSRMVNPQKHIDELLAPDYDYDDDERQRRIEKEGEQNDMAEARRKR